MTPWLQPFYPCSHPKPHVGRTRIPLYLLALQAFSLHLRDKQWVSKGGGGFSKVIPISSTGGVHTERCNAAIPDFPLISPPPLALKACIQLMASEEYPLIFRGKDSCKNAIPSAQEPAAPPPGIPAHSPPSQVGREVPPAPRHPAQK